MSKHKHHHNQQPNNQNAPSEQVDQDLLASSLGAAAPSGEDGEPSNESSQAEVPVPEQPVEQKDEPEAPAPVEEQKPVTATAPAVQTVDMDKQTAAPTPSVRMITPRRVVTQTKTQIDKVRNITSDVSEDLKMHTREGRALIRAFDEYEELCRTTRADDRDRQIILAKKLFDIMGTCCPRRGNPNNGVIQELIKIVFKRLSLGYGNMYKDSTLLRQDYNLPSPADAMRFDTFWTVMYQLVESAKTGSRITYNTTTVSKIINSPAAMTTISSIRRRLESR